jgi:hypothetical protein
MLLCAPVMGFADLWLLSLSGRGSFAWLAVGITGKTEEVSRATERVLLGLLCREMYCHLTTAGDGPRVGID